MTCKTYQFIKLVIFLFRMAWIENIGYILNDPVVAGKFKWSVPNFVAFDGDSVKSCVSSPWFSFKKHKWRLILLPNSCEMSVVNRYGCWEEKNVEHIGVFLWNKCSKYQKDEFRFTIRLECSGNREILPYKGVEYSLSVTGTGILKSGGNFGCRHFIPKESLKTFYGAISPNGNMSFVCEITKLDSSEKTEAGGNKEIKDDNQECTNDDKDEECSDDVDGEYSDDEEDAGDISLLDTSSDKKKNNSLNAKGFERLLENFQQMFIDGQNSDMILKVENEEIPVHKNILSVRSPVFASMLQHDMKEKKSSAVDIPDCSSGAFKVFLLYLYTGKSDTISQENVFGVYYASDKYQVDDLKEYCTQFMKTILSVDTFCDIIALSLQHSESDLQKAATRFFCKNMKKIIKTARWQTYLQNNPTHANELYIKAVKA